MTFFCFCFTSTLKYSILYLFPNPTSMRNFVLISIYFVLITMDRRMDGHPQLDRLSSARQYCRCITSWGQDQYFVVLHFFGSIKCIKPLTHTLQVIKIHTYINKSVKRSMSDDLLDLKKTFKNAFLKNPLKIYQLQVL